MEGIKKSQKSVKEKQNLSSKKDRPKIDFEQLKQTILQNVKSTRSNTYVQYTKERLKTYIRNPASNINTLRDISAFLVRNSMIYKKIIAYIAQMPLYLYNILYRTDVAQGTTDDNFLSNYQQVLTRLQEFNMQKEFQTVVSTALRDGVYYGFVYDYEGDGFFLYALDPQYCKISSIDNYGNYIFAFDAQFFSQGDNAEFVEGIDGDMSGVWDQVFIDGYRAYQQDTVNNRWFDLPPEKTLCLLADEDALVPLPYFLPIFTSLLDLLDLEQILASKTELQNYVLLLSKIPLIPNTNEVDDFAVSLDVVRAMQDAINEVVPDLVGTAFTPCELEVIHFDQANSTDDTDALSKSMNNLFSNLGFSELVVSSGSSTNSVGLKFSIQNDEAFALKYVDRLQIWVNSYIRRNYSEDFIFKFHRFTYFSQPDYINQMKEAATLGLPVAMDYATALGRSPYEIMCATYMEHSLGIKGKNSLWEPLQSSYTQSTTNSSSGAPEKDPEDLTDEGIATRDDEKNATTAASK